MLVLLRLIGRVLGELGYHIGIRREGTLDNLRHAFPEKTEWDIRRIARASTRNLAVVFAEFLYLRIASKNAIADGLVIDNLPEILTAAGPGGAILLGGHHGNWEWLAVAFGINSGRPVSVVIKNQRSSIAEQFMVRMRTRFGNKMLNAGDGSRVFRALKGGELLGILSDQTAGEQDMRVPFFGREVPSFEGAARLALQTNAPIIFFEFRERTSKGYLWRLHLIDHSDLSGSTPEHVKILTARHTAYLESIIRQKPEFWLWQHKRWKHARPNADN
jgi:KDO2-lipid IV(A) lauroyltransferase